MNIVLGSIHAHPTSRAAGSKAEKTPEDIGRPTEWLGARRPIGSDGCDALQSGSKLSILRPSPVPRCAIGPGIQEGSLPAMSPHPATMPYRRRFLPIVRRSIGGVQMDSRHLGWFRGGC
jgi:hypothetical protein